MDQPYNDGNTLEFQAFTIIAVQLILRLRVIPSL
jgi:hypothetical protein